MDNDDSTTDFNPNDETVGMAFGTTHEEFEGFPTEAIDPNAVAEGPGGMPPMEEGVILTVGETQYAAGTYT